MSNGVLIILLIVILLTVIFFISIEMEKKKKKAEEKKAKQRIIDQERLEKIRRKQEELDRIASAKRKQEELRKNYTIEQERIQEKLRREKIKKEKNEKEAPDLMYIYIKYTNDWNQSSHERKIKSCLTYRQDNILIYQYNFICGSILYLVGTDKIVFIDVNKIGDSIEDKTSVYKKVDETILKLFKQSINATINYINFSKKYEDLNKEWEQKFNQSKYEDLNKKWEQRFNQSKQQNQGRQSQEENKFKDHPKWGTYEILIKTAKSRKDQIAKMSIKDPNRQNMINELTSVESRIKSFKEKYKF